MRFDVADTARAGTPGVVRILLSLVAVALMISASPAGARARKEHVASYAPPFSAMVIDPVSQKTLYEVDADGPRHPASLTKVMTLYILFEELESGRLQLDSTMAASWKAINQAPSRLGLQKGETITVENAIKAVVTRSANDVAMLIAENIGGSEQDFVTRMNATAAEIGMRNTTFANPTGLPDKRQITTARDLVLLGKAIRERFPSLFTYFSLRSFEYGGKTVFSHNKLMNRLQGMEGIKTGFINASGFNLLASVRRDRQSVIAVVLGGATARARDTRMTELVETYLPKATPADLPAATAQSLPPGASAFDAAQPTPTLAFPPTTPRAPDLADTGFHRSALEGSDPSLFVTTGTVLSTPQSRADLNRGPDMESGAAASAGESSGTQLGTGRRLLIALAGLSLFYLAVALWRVRMLRVILLVVVSHVAERLREDMATLRQRLDSGLNRARPNAPAQDFVPPVALMPPPPRPAPGLGLRYEIPADAAR